MKSFSFFLCLFTFVSTFSFDIHDSETLADLSLLKGVKPTIVKTEPFKPSEIEIEFYGSLSQQFTPPNGITLRGEPLEENGEYEKFITEGLEYQNLEKYLGGDFEGNGGHPALSKIQLLQEDFEQVLENEIDYSKSFALYKHIKKRIKIICSPIPLKSNGGFVLAKNFPHKISPTIYFDCHQFMNFDLEDQRLLVFHEILPLLGVQDVDYKHSLYLIDQYSETIINLN